MGVLIKTTRKKRRYGTGSLQVRVDPTGAETWYGLWYLSGIRIHRRLGLKTAENGAPVLTRLQAEEVLARSMGRRLSKRPSSKQATAETSAVKVQAAAQETAWAEQAAESRTERAEITRALNALYTAEDHLARALRERLDNNGRVAH